MSALEIKLTAKCIIGHKWTMTDKQIADAKSFGCAMCPTCGNPATVRKIEAKPRAARVNEGRGRDA